MTRERETEYLTRELLNYDKLQLIAILYKVAEDAAAEKVRSSTGKKASEWEAKEMKLHKKLTFQFIQGSMLKAQMDK